MSQIKNVILHFPSDNEVAVDLPEFTPCMGGTVGIFKFI